EKRLYPAIHPMLSATRREDLLYHPEEWERVQLLRKAMAALPPIEAMEKLIDNLNATKTNAELRLSGVKWSRTWRSFASCFPTLNQSVGWPSIPSTKPCIAPMRHLVCSR